MVQAASGMRAVINVATGRYVNGQNRLGMECVRQDTRILSWARMPEGSPAHEQVPYAFKAYALKAASNEGYTTLLWADASVLPIKPLDPLFERIEQDGYWMSNNGWTNYEWTADSAYPDLFSDLYKFADGRVPENFLNDLRRINRTIPHVVATAFGISLKHPLGKAFLDEYFRLASETKAFCGPWINRSYRPLDCYGDNYPVTIPSDRCYPCGPPDVRGHRHDQSTASVIAWQLGFKLTNAPEIFAYRGGEKENTILVADGAY